MAMEEPLPVNYPPVSDKPVEDPKEDVEKPSDDGEEINVGLLNKILELIFKLLNKMTGGN
jgi:hypothetical protein